MVERAEREPTMEEIVVALRETRRGADRAQPFPVPSRVRNQRGLPAIGSSTDLADLRDNEIERLLAENSRLNARVVSLLKVIEQEQARHTEAAPNEADRDAIYNEVRAALEAELTPILLVLLRLIDKHRPDAPEASRPAREVALPTVSEAGPSDWIIDLMHRLEARAPAPNETVADADAMPRRSKLRDRMTEVLNAFRLEPYGPPPRRPQPPPEQRP